MRVIIVEKIEWKSGVRPPLSFDYIFDQEEEDRLDFNDMDSMVDYMTGVAEFQFSGKIEWLGLGDYYEVEETQSNKIYRVIKINRPRQKKFF